MSELYRHASRHALDNYHTGGHRRLQKKTKRQVAEPVSWIRRVQKFGFQKVVGHPKLTRLPRTGVAADQLHSRTSKSQTLRRGMQNPLHARSKKNTRLRKQAVRLYKRLPKPIRRTIIKAALAKRQHKLLGNAVPIAVLCLFLLGVGVIVKAHLDNQNVKKQLGEVAGVAKENGTFDAENDDIERIIPDETPPDVASYGQYIVAPDVPRFLKIPKFDVYSRTIRVGVLPDGKMGVPYNVYDTGWFDQSAKPGQDGAMLIDGHVSGPTVRGVFYNIKNLEKGDEIVVERGDGQSFSYEVVTKDVTNYKNTNMKKAINSIDPNKQGLNLITCTGRYDPSIHLYEERVVVYAVRK